MTRPILVLGALGILSGCGALGLNSAADRAETENTLPFGAKLETFEENPRGFAVVVAAASDTAIDEFRESARFEATKHCLYTFGRSDVIWDRDEAGEWVVASRDGSPVVTGACDPR